MRAHPRLPLLVAVVVAVVVSCLDCTLHSCTTALPVTHLLVLLLLVVLLLAVVVVVLVVHHRRSSPRSRREFVLLALLALLAVICVVRFVVLVAEVIVQLLHVLVLVIALRLVCECIHLVEKLPQPPVAAVRVRRVPSVVVACLAVAIVLVEEVGALRLTRRLVHLVLCSLPLLLLLLLVLLLFVVLVLVLVIGHLSRAIVSIAILGFRLHASDSMTHVRHVARRLLRIHSPPLLLELRVHKSQERLVAHLNLEPDLLFVESVDEQLRIWTDRPRLMLFSCGAHVHTHTHTCRGRRSPRSDCGRPQSDAHVLRADGRRAPPSKSRFARDVSVLTCSCEPTAKSFGRSAHAHETSPGSSTCDVVADESPIVGLPTSES